MSCFMISVFEAAKKRAGILQYYYSPQIKAKMAKYAFRTQLLIPLGMFERTWNVRKGTAKSIK